MKSPYLLCILILVVALSACNLPSSAAVTETPTPASALTETPTLSLATQAPTQITLPANTPPPAATSTPSVPVAFPSDVAVNCRLGPGTGWIVLSGLSAGTSSQITGRSGDGGWWQITDPLNSSRRCWVAASVTNTAGNLTGMPVVEAPEPEVTSVSISVSPNTINALACTGAGSPIELAGAIETNGPTSVTWYFETQQGGQMTTQTTEFDAFGELELSTSYTPLLTAGTYWVRLVVTSPNSEQAEATYTITCP